MSPAWSGLQSQHSKRRWRWARHPSSCRFFAPENEPKLHKTDLQTSYLECFLPIKEKIQKMLDLRHTHCQRTLPTLDDLAAIPHLSYSAFPPERFMQLSSKATGPSAPPKTAGAYQAAQPRSQQQRAATKRSLQSRQAR